MRYEKVTTGTFISRPNRFIAMVEIDGVVHKRHVKTPAAPTNS
jgi:sugar fermentation stimulation protein A